MTCPECVVCVAGLVETLERMPVQTRDGVEYVEMMTSQIAVITRTLRRWMEPEPQCATYVPKKSAFWRKYARLRISGERRLVPEPAWHAEKSFPGCRHFSRDQRRRAA